MGLFSGSAAVPVTGVAVTVVPVAGVGGAAVSVTGVKVAAVPVAGAGGAAVPVVLLSDPGTFASP